MPPASLAAARLLPTLFDASPGEGWSMGMRHVTHALLDSLDLPEGPVLEIGCGGGQLLADLQARHPQRAVLGVDLHPLALAHAQRRVTRPWLAQAALQHLPYAGETFALLLALDVFDQEGVDLTTALVESRRVLRPGGLLLLRVSAHPWLFGAHDHAFHTGRRYTRREVVGALAAQGFGVRRVTYANTVLGAPVAGLRLLQRWGLLSWQPSVYGDPSANRLVAAALAWEARHLRHANLPIGLSLWALAERGVGIGQ